MGITRGLAWTEKGSAVGLKTSEESFTTTKSVPEIGRALQAAFAAAKVDSIDDIVSGSGALSGFDDRASIEVVGSGGSLLGGQWAVQVYVHDRGDAREVVLVALGDGGFTRAWNGARNTASLSLSTKKRDVIRGFLR